jgi:alkanesulfonate monooxygenase SsuD/methylene tetrahydromethanopterin reductase-like flavin-dependent oxidoreductase (luciferase family)
MHYTVDAMRFLPRPTQRPGIPIWVAGFYGKPKPLRRAIRYQGFFPVGLEHPDQLAEIASELTRLRQAMRPDAAGRFDIAVELKPGSDPVPYAAAGATWGLVAFPWNPVSVDQVRGVIQAGPARTP